MSKPSLSKNSNLTHGKGCDKETFKLTLLISYVDNSSSQKCKIII